VGSRRVELARRVVAGRGRRTGLPPLRAGFADGKPRAGTPEGLVLGTPRTLVVGPVVELEGLQLGALRPLLRLATRDPQQHKWAAPATLQGEPARAVHERVWFP